MFFLYDKIQDVCATQAKKAKRGKQSKRGAAPYQPIVTCPARNLTSYNLNSGHYKPVSLVGSNNKWSWDERFIRSQCGRCNGAGQGMAREFEARLRREIGDRAVEDFENSYRKVNPVKDWKAVKAYYEALLANL